MMSDEYKSGFESGIEFCEKHFDASTGRNRESFPDRFVHRGDVWSCGFGEGLITGRAIAITKKFGKIKSISYINDKAIIT